MGQGMKIAVRVNRVYFLKFDLACSYDVCLVLCYPSQIKELCMYLKENEVIFQNYRLTKEN